MKKNQITSGGDFFWLTLYMHNYNDIHPLLSLLDHLYFPNYISPTAVLDMHHLTFGIDSLLHFVNLILFTVLLVHLILYISPHHSPHLCSHHLSLPSLSVFFSRLKTHRFHKSLSTTVVWFHVNCLHRVTEHCRLFLLYIYILCFWLLTRLR